MGPRPSFPCQEKDSIEGQFGRMRFGASKMHGHAINTQNRYIVKTNIIPDVSIFAVFNGHECIDVPIYLERHFLQELLENKSFLIGDYGSALIETFLRMDELMNSEEGKKELHLIRSENKPTLGIDFHFSSACVVLLVGNEIYVANLGDTRCILLSDRETIALSKEDKGEVEKAGGSAQRRVNGFLRIAMTVEEFEYEENSDLSLLRELVSAVPDIRKRTLKEKDKLFVLANKDVWEFATDEQIMGFLEEQIKENESLTIAIEELFRKISAPCHGRPTIMNNMTCILVKLE